jgi:transketolase C-terminal domain/subunit
MMGFLPLEVTILNATDFSRLLQAHRSIRRYQDRAVQVELIDQVLIEALAGSSSSGNLNMVSVI